MGDLLHYVGSVFLSGPVSIHGVVDEVHRLDFLQLAELSNLVPGLDPVVGAQESVQLNTWGQTFQLFNLVIRNPQLLESLPDLVKSNDSLNVIPAERQNFQTFKFW